uniref:Uncharacterized protein n=1 Tax=Setaria italica TaxID=4555 RepID=K3XTG5_SETIT
MRFLTPWRDTYTGHSTITAKSPRLTISSCVVR